jgi:hypothetical protein
MPVGGGSHIDLRKTKLPTFFLLKNLTLMRARGSATCALVFHLVKISDRRTSG